MKQIFIKFSMLAAVAMLITACSKDNNEDNTSEPVTSIKFNMSEAPYNDDVEMAGSRAAVTEIIKDTFDMGGIEAEVTLERDSEQPKQETRTITSGNHYTIVAFKAGTSIEVASTKGHFNASGAFVYDTGVNPIQLAPANYDFVCYTHQYATRSGNNIEIPLQHADKAFVCRQPNVTIANTKKQEIAFTMKHAGVRVRTKIMAFMVPTGINATLGYQANSVPASTVYDMTTGTFSASTTKSGDVEAKMQRFDTADTNFDSELQDNLETVTGDNYLTVLAGTKPEELVYNIMGGTVYNKPLNTNGNRKLKAGNAFDANGAYTCTIRLLPTYVYLFEDGQTGRLKDSGRANHVPIALVYAPHKAIALWNFGGEGDVVDHWIRGYNYAQHNSSAMLNTVEDALNSTTSGKVWTWESYDSRHDGNPIIKANELADFPVYYWAGKYYQDFYLKDRLMAKGKTLAPSLNKDEVWYLPSLSEWRDLFVKLGFGDDSSIPIYYSGSWQGNMVNYAFKVAQGISITNSSKTYWSSSEQSNSYVYYVSPSRYSMGFESKDKRDFMVIRAFVEF